MSTTRVCQQFGPYIPREERCLAALDKVYDLYPNVVTPRTAPYAGNCNIVSTDDTCALALCTYPGDVISTDKYVAAVNETINNCYNNLPTKARARVVGGYDFIPGTNSLYHVFSNYSPRNAFTSSNPTISPNSTDCATLANGLNKTAIYAQTSDTGCSRIKTSTSCSASICGPKGAQLSGAEFTDTVAYLAQSSTFDGYSGGVDALGTNFNVTLWNGPLIFRPGPVAATPRVCYSGNAKAPLIPDCAQLAKELPAKYPGNITIFNTPSTQASGCITVHQSGTCQAQYCGRVGTTTTTSNYLTAFNDVSNNCQGGATYFGTPQVWTYGHYRNNDSSVVVTAAEPARNVVCNVLRSSPQSTDCDTLIASLPKATLFKRTSAAPCQIAAQQGTCKLNFCSTPDTTLSGQQLFDLATGIQKNCTIAAGSSTKTSGFIQVNPYTNISLYS